MRPHRVLPLRALEIPAVHEVQHEHESGAALLQLLQVWLDELPQVRERMVSEVPWWEWSCNNVLPELRSRGEGEVDG